MFPVLLHHISQYTSIGDCGQSEYSSERNRLRMLVPRRGRYVMADDVCVVCLAPSGSSVINLANQTNLDINYRDLIASVYLQRCFQTNNNILYF